VEARDAAAAHLSVVFVLADTDRTLEPVFAALLAAGHRVLAAYTQGDAEFLAELRERYPGFAYEQLRPNGLWRFPAGAVRRRRDRGGRGKLLRHLEAGMPIHRTVRAFLSRHAPSVVVEVGSAPGEYVRAAEMEGIPSLRLAEGADAAVDTIEQAAGTPVAPRREGRLLRPFLLALTPLLALTLPLARPGAVVRAATRVPRRLTGRLRKRARARRRTAERRQSESRRLAAASAKEQKALRAEAKTQKIARTEAKAQRAARAEEKAARAEEKTKKAAEAEDEDA
jgi:hypothetical protein